jgi:hypothetical protein
VATGDEVTIDVEGRWTLADVRRRLDQITEPNYRYRTFYLDGLPLKNELTVDAAGLREGDMITMRPRVKVIRAARP